MLCLFFSLLVTVSEQVVVTEPEVVLEKGAKGLLPCNVIPGIEVGIVCLAQRTYIQGSRNIG